MKQDTFIKAALDPDAPVPEGLVDTRGRPATKRFNVYRNNIVVGLKDALTDGFPAVASLVGSDFFSAMAGAYLRAHPPSAPMIPLYGGGFADFIAQFPPAASLPYLADVARLEYAMRESYHAADSTPVPADAFADPSVFTKQVTLAPALRFLASAYPVTAIRDAALSGSKATGGAEDVIITRPGFDPCLHAFPAGANAILIALKEGLTIGEAMELAPSGLDLTAFLSALLSGGAFIKLKEVQDV